MQHRCKAILRNGFSNWILAVWFPRKQRKTVLFFLNTFHHFRNFPWLKWYHSIQRISSSRSYFFWPVTTDTGAGSEFHPATRSLALSRAEDLRAELLRAEHLKAEAVWEDSSRWAKTGMLFFFFFGHSLDVRNEYTSCLPFLKKQTTSCSLHFRVSVEGLINTDWAPSHHRHKHGIQSTKCHCEKECSSRQSKAASLWK